MDDERTYFSKIWLIYETLREKSEALIESREKLTKEFNSVLDGDISQKAVDVFVNRKTDQLKRFKLEYDMGEMGIDLEIEGDHAHNGNLEVFARALILCAEKHIILEFISVINDTKLVKHPEFVSNYIPAEVLSETVISMAIKAPSVARHLSFSDLLDKECKEKLDNIFYDYCLD